MGTDNASVMVGINNGVNSNLKQGSHSLILMRSVCHFIKLAISHASAECLLRNWQYLITKLIIALQSSV